MHRRIDSVRPSREKGEIQGRIAHIDHFGNLITTIPLSLVPDLFTAPRASAVFPTRSASSQFPAPIERRHTFFARSGEDGVPFLYGDSSGYVGIAVRNDSAARMLGVDYGTKVTLVIAGE